MKNTTLLLSTILMAACSSAHTSASSEQVTTDRKTKVLAASGETDTAIVAGGCFWCVESDFEKHPGVIEVVSGYVGGDLQDPTYRNHGQHIEGAKITFDPAQVSYKELIDFYWTTIDPTDPGGQFCDRGHAYTTAIFARPDQIEIAKASKDAIAVSKPFDGPIVTPVLEAKTFWNAEEYHQDYYKKNPVRYNLYRKGCGRDKRVEKLWGQSVSH